MSNKLGYKESSVLSQGYGIIPKKVMKDKNLSVESKAIYAYMCSFAGSGNSVFPSAKLIMSDLNISEKRFYKYRKELLDFGYITIEKQRNSNRRDNNLYILEQDIFEHCRFERVQTESVQNEGTNNNSLNNNNINNINISKDILCSTQDLKEIIDSWNRLNLSKVVAINKNTNRYKLLKARINEYGLSKVIEAINLISESSFLKGQNKNNWTISFDWLLKPNNFIKVLEGNYIDKGAEKSGSFNEHSTKDSIYEGFKPKEFKGSREEIDDSKFL